MTTYLSFTDALTKCTSGTSHVARNALAARFADGLPSGPFNLHQAIMTEANWSATFAACAGPAVHLQTQMKLPTFLCTFLDHLSFDRAHPAFLTASGHATVLAHLTALKQPSEAIRQAVDNIEKFETRLLGITWWQLFESTLNASQLPDKMEVAITRVLKRYKLHGPHMDVAQHALLGRLVGYDSFRQSTKRYCSNRVFGSILATAKRRGQSGAFRIPSQLVDLFLNAGPMWATFSTHPSSPDPFAGLPRAGVSLARILGLQYHLRPKKGWLKLRYKLPANEPARFPTVAEAYSAGLSGAYPFLPADRFSTYARTRPSAARVLQPLPKGAVGVPECIHAPIQFSCLREPLESTL
jgi:hypothetical protein